MRSAQRLLRLYPRAWRDRYGQEFLEIAGTEPLRLQQIVDIVSGAIDAWLSADVRGVTRIQSNSGGEMTMMKAISICERNQMRYTVRDGAIGAAVMIASTLAFVFAGLALRGNGFTQAAAVVLNSSFLASLMLSMPFWLMKGQSRTAQLVIVGGTLTLVVAINLVAELIIAVNVIAALL